MTDVPVSVAAIGATLGEGPVWIGRDRALWFVDIKALRIYRFDPRSGTLGVWSAPSQPGWVLPARDGSLVAGLQTGLHRFDPADGSFNPIHHPEAAVPGNRLNDATTDRAGRIWFGTMDDGETLARGRLYRASAGDCRDSGLAPVAITNGPALSPDGRTLYHTDTLGKRIWRMPLGEDGMPGAPQLFVEIEAGAGHPDGSVTDAEGCIWVGLFGGWGVRRYDSDGRLVRHVALPIANVTKLAFGGEDLRTAYVTTARKGLDAAALAQQPLAGNLFAFDPGVAGLPVTPAAL